MTPTAHELGAAPPMHGYRRVAWAGLSAIVMVASIPLAISTISALVGGDLAGLPFFLIFLFLPLNLGLVGAVLATRRPDNRIGWLLLVAGTFAAVCFVGGEYERFAF